jgi:integrase
LSDADVSWLGAGEKAKPAVAERVEEGRTFESLADEWIDGVTAGRIQRRRRGKPEPYAPTTIPTYRRDLTYLLKPRFGERPADGIDEREWQAFFDELTRTGLSYSRLANVKAVAGSIYAWALHRTRRHVTSNPLAYVDLGPNLGKRRERVALAEEAADLLLALPAEDQVPYGVAFYGGLRRGEIQRLDWADVEMIEGKPGAWMRVAPAPGKSGEGRRLPIAEPLRAILLRAYQRQGRPPHGRVCEVSVMSGKIAERAMRAWGWKRDSSEDEWRKARTDALSPITLHECRHHLRLVPDGRGIQPAGDHGVHGPRRPGDYRSLCEGPTAAGRSGSVRPLERLLPPDRSGDLIYEVARVGLDPTLDLGRRHKEELPAGHDHDERLNPPLERIHAHAEGRCGLLTSEGVPRHRLRRTPGLAGGHRRLPSESPSGKGTT